MKRLWIFFILIVLAGGTGKALSSNNEAAKDSLLQILDTLPADSSRLEMLYSLAYLDPMSPSCVYYLGKLLEEATTQDNKYYQCLALYATLSIFPAELHSETNHFLICVEFLFSPARYSNN